MGPLLNKKHKLFDQMGTKIATIQLYFGIQEGKTKLCS